MSDSRSNIYMDILKEEANKYADSKDELDLLIQKSSALLALSMKPAALNERIVRKVIEDGMG